MKIKVAFINYSLDIGGIETLILEIGKRLNRDIFDPSVFIFRKDGKLRSEFAKWNIPVIEIRKNGGFDWFLPLRLSRALKQHSVDIVHTHNPANWLYGGIAARLAGFPLVHTEHTTCDYHNYHVRRWKLIERILARFTDVISAVSESVKDYMVNIVHISPSKLKVVHNAVNLEDFNIQIDRALLKRQLKLKKKDIVIGNIARFYENKDQQTLLRALKIVLDDYKNVFLLLAGDGPLKEKMQDLAKDLKINKQVQFLGNRRDIPNLLKIMDIFVLSSKREGLPIVLLEAMASGVPVVATNVDGNGELVTHNETGMLVLPNNPKALAEVIIQLLKDKARMKKIGINGKNRVEKEFTFATMVRTYEDIYKSLVNGKISKKL